MNNLVKKSIKDTKGFWTDFYTEDGNYLIAQGYNELEKAEGKPWALIKIVSDTKWSTLGYFKTTAEAAKQLPES